MEKGGFEIATFNICGVLKHQEESKLNVRIEWLKKYLLSQQIDFFALQEVSFEVWKELKNSAELLGYQLYPEKYNWSDHVEDHVIVCFLSKSKTEDIKLEFFPQHSKNLDYCFLSMKFVDLQIINIHLNSGVENTYLRERQLQYIKSRVIRKIDENNVIILGDFNSDLNHSSDSCLKMLGEEWLDAWNEIGVGNGFTQDPEKNYLRKLFGHSKGKRRVDGILYRQNNYLRPKKIEIFGCEQIKEKLYPSDHYGVKCTFSA